MSALSPAKSIAREPSKRVLVGILAGGLGVSAMAKRRRDNNPDERTTTSPLQPAETQEESPLVSPLPPVSPVPPPVSPVPPVESPSAVSDPETSDPVLTRR
jgi:hypothetical protein